MPFWSAVSSVQWQWLVVWRLMMIYQQEGNEATVTTHHLSQSDAPLAGCRDQTLLPASLTSLRSNKVNICVGEHRAVTTIVNFFLVIGDQIFALK